MLFISPFFEFEKFLLPGEKDGYVQQGTLPPWGQALVPEGDYEAHCSPYSVFPILESLEGTERSHVLGSGKSEQGTALSLVMASCSMRAPPISLKYSLSFFFFLFHFPSLPYSLTLQTLCQDFKTQRPAAEQAWVTSRTDSPAVWAHLGGCLAQGPLQEHLLHHSR